MEYNIKIDEFEGPLDLLLHLIKQSNINIYDISIDEITKNYLDYINKMEQLNINVASSYLVMAAELMEIKSKSLLPKVEEEKEEDEEVSKDSLINKLVEYQKYKEISSKFRILELNRNNIYVKPPENINNYFEEQYFYQEEEEDINRLVEAFKEFLTRKALDKPLKTKITNKEYSVKERKESIKKILLERKTVSFTELFDTLNRAYIAVTFLSILEMTKENTINIKQEKNFENIYLEMRG